MRSKKKLNYHKLYAKRRQMYLISRQQRANPNGFARLKFLVEGKEITKSNVGNIDWKLAFNTVSKNVCS